jgi:hypothetical protein
MSLIPFFFERVLPAKQVFSRCSKEHCPGLGEGLGEGLGDGLGDSPTTPLVQCECPDLTGDPDFKPHTFPVRVK